MEENVVAVDFDGTIVEFDEWNDGEAGDLLEEENPRKNLQRLVDAGFVVIIYTCRGEEYLEPVYETLEKHDIPYHFVNENPYQEDTIADIKMHADWYIDDRAPTFKGLEHAVNLILGEEKTEVTEKTPAPA